MPAHGKPVLELSSLIVKDVDGADTRLGDLWRTRPAVLVFLRHYG